MKIPSSRQVYLSTAGCCWGGKHRRYHLRQLLRVIVHQLGVPILSFISGS